MKLFLRAAVLALLLPLVLPVAARAQEPPPALEMTFAELMAACRESLEGRDGRDGLVKIFGRAVTVTGLIKTVSAEDSRLSAALGSASSPGLINCRFDGRDPRNDPGRLTAGQFLTVTGTVRGAGAVSLPRGGSRASRPLAVQMHDCVMEP